MVLPDILLDHEGALRRTPGMRCVGLSRAQVQREIERVNVAWRSTQVQEALARRAEFVKQLTQELVDELLRPTR